MTEKRILAKKQRLDGLTKEYCKLEEEKRQYYTQKLADGDLSSHTIQSLYLQQMVIDHHVKMIVKTVDWFYRNDAEFDNECATLVYNYYAPMMHNGLNCLTV